ncbi:3-isopropylmalate dehydratase small subunit [Kitasatospora sp. NPDC018058]|uniref:3-isopropylmalate dehydratase small subunit n=1 Tax=Kitasatospora sp. NPDC018058 TaxID=3364025 RepID=UPI0037C169D4
MRSFTVHTGTAVPLRRSNVDTDQIIPGEFCKRIGRTGYADALFAEWRDSPDYILAQPQYLGASVLVAGRDFGIGSSREHAVWALVDHGFRAVIAPSFSDIFRGNALGNGLLAVQAAQETVERLWDLVESAPDTPVLVDLERNAVTAGEIRFGFTIEEHLRQRLLLGLDEIGNTLRWEEEIASYEQRRPGWMPRTVPARTS